MQIFLVQLQQRVTLRSVIWLHDGAWIPSEVEERDIRFAESVMLQAFSVRYFRTAFQVTCWCFPPHPRHFHYFRAPRLPRRST